ncbi:FUSC family protein [Arthrobacter sp. R-11]|uniref:FUSC family protein n=1 Tax=Arthrobacter sp. R-11 TaxID=3404053 RepID=UPI003CEFFE59
MANRLLPYLRAGYHRCKASISQSFVMALCAVTAYLFAEHVLGHASPVFAAVAALLTLQFSGDWRTRRALEVAIGCMLGVTAGVVLTHILGNGPAQAILIVFVATLMARFLNKGAVFATQMAIQATLVAMIPSAQGSSLHTILDASVGGAIAWIATAVVPTVRLKRPREAIRKLTHEISAVLLGTSEALEANDSTLAWHALIRARNSQSVIVEAKEVLGKAREGTIISPFQWRHREHIRRSLLTAEKLDLALRNSRVFSRRLTHSINSLALPEEGALQFSRFLKHTAQLVAGLGENYCERDPKRRESGIRQTLSQLMHLAAELAPDRFHAATVEGQALILTFRPFMVDLMEAAGATHTEALAALPNLASFGSPAEDLDLQPSAAQRSAAASTAPGRNGP